MTNIAILKVAELIDSGKEVAETLVIPKDLKSFTILEFTGNAAFSPNSSVMIVWDYGGTESIIWATAGSEITNLEYEIKDYNGVKKLAIICSNGENGPVVMSGLIKIRLES